MSDELTERCNVIDALTRVSGNKSVTRTRPSAVRHRHFTFTLSVLKLNTMRQVFVYILQVNTILYKIHF